MRVCVLATSFPIASDGSGACGNFIHNLTQELSGRIRIVVIAPHAVDARTKEVFNEVEVIRFRYFFPEKLQKIAYGERGVVENLKKDPILFLQLPVFLLSFLFKCFKVARQSDLIHANWVATGAIAIIIKKLLHIPIVLTVHNTRLRHYPKWLSTYVIKNVDAVISPHPELTEVVRSMGKKELFEIPNMIDFSRSCELSDRNSLKEEFGIGNQFVVAFVARLVEWKDPITFVKAIPHVIDQMKNVKFLLVGGGTLENALRKLAGTAGARHYLTMTGTRNDVQDILGISDIFVALSPIENIWSVTIVEAMNSGVPCIVTRAGSTGKVMKHEKNAYLIPPRNEIALAEGIVRLLEDQPLRSRLSKGGAMLMSDTGVSRENILRKTLSVYERTLNRISRG